MQPPVDSLVTELFGHLRGLDRTSLFTRLRPGLPAPAVAATLSEAGLGQPPPLLDWFHRADGVDAEGDVVLGDLCLLPGYYPLSLSDALQQRAAANWQPHWLPVLASGGGDFFLVDTTHEAAPVVEFIVYDQPGVQVAKGLADFLRLAVRAFEEGVVYVDDDGYLEQDDERWGEMLATIT